MKWYDDIKSTDDVVISSRVRLARNLCGFPFPSRLDETGAKKVALVVKQALENSDTQKYTYTEMNKNTRGGVLMEEHVVSPAFCEDSELYRALITNEAATLSVMINEEDHVRIQSIKPGLMLDEALSEANEADDILIKGANVAYDENIGFLTACPTNLGTGLRASVMLHLPALSSFGYIKSIVNLMGKIGLTVRGMYGEGSEQVANMYQLSNQVTLGISEQDTISKLKSATMQIVERERELRRQMTSQPGSDTADKLWRSLGTLKYARKIDTQEAARLISNVRLGVSCGIMPEIKDKNLIRLLFEIMPSHIVERFPEAQDSALRDKYRADVIREYLN